MFLKEKHQALRGARGRLVQERDGLTVPPGNRGGQERV